MIFMWWNALFSRGAIQGTTVDEVLRNIKEVISLCIEGKKQGISIVKTTICRKNYNN